MRKGLISTVTTLLFVGAAVFGSGLFLMQGVETLPSTPSQLMDVSNPVETIQSGQQQENLDEVQYESHIASSADIEEMMASIGIRDADKNYNEIIDGFGTGLAPPTEQEWEALVGELKIVNSVEGDKKLAGGGPLGASNDLMTHPSFPAVGNQANEGSCVSWSTGYYTNGFMQAKDYGWTDQHQSWGTANKDHVMSPDWLYHKVNGGSDSGSSMIAPMRVVSTVGNAPESYMPYSTSDHTSWGNESAWRMAPIYRANGVETTSVNNIDVVKSWVDNGYAVPMALNAGQYSNGWADGNGILSSAEYNPGSPNHANTVVGYDDAITDDGDVGAFKIVNSWGASWGPYSNGTYYMTYEAFKTLTWGFAFKYISDKDNYEPSLLAVWNIDPQGARNAPVELGVGPYGNPEETRVPIWNGGSHDFPFFMALDVTEFEDNWDAGTYSFYLEILAGASSSTISSFKLESYKGGYTPGSPTETSNESPDTPETTPGYVTLWFPSGQGRVNFDNVAYKSDAIATIVLADKHLNMNPSAVETYVIDEVRSDPTGDSETTTVVLTEIGSSAAVFTGTIQLQLGASNANDGILQIANGDTITVRYEDGNNGTGNPATVTDTAQVDDDPPIISSVTATPYYMTSVISWITNEDSDSGINYDLATPPNLVESDTVKTTVHSITLTGLTMDTEYYFSVSSTDYAGNTVTDENWGAYYSFTTLAPENAPWSDDMDSGHDWMDTEDDGAGTEWEMGDPSGFGPGTAHSGINCWGTNLGTDYTNEAEARLTLPPIDLTLAATSTMTFWNWFEIEADWDIGFVEISTDLGNSWTRIAPVGDYPSQNGYFGDGYSGNSAGWLSSTEEEFDLSQYLGNVVIIGFHFISDRALTYSGWYVDDISVDATYSPNGVTITPSEQSKSGVISSTVSYRSTVINIGSGGSDTFDMTYFSPSGWTADFYEPDGVTPLADTNINGMPDTGSLSAAGGSKEIVLKVNIPGSASFTDSDAATITATSATNPLVSDSATLTTTVPYYIVSQLSGTSPTIDGIITPGEWTGSEVVDISGSSSPPDSVTLYVRNDQTMLYIAVDDTNDPSLGAGDKIGIYFDDNHDHEWPTFSSQTGEGNFWVEWDGTAILNRFRGIWGNGPNYDTAILAVGLNGNLSDASGNMQYEAAIDLTTSAMRSIPGETIGLFIFSKDGPSNTFYGEWPPNTLTTWRNPRTYGDLILAVDDVPPVSSVNMIPSYWQNNPPLTITASATDTGGSVASVELFYRFSTTNLTWGGWSSFGVDTIAPWDWAFDFPAGDGYYEFKTIAKDSADNIEIDTSTDEACGYDTGLPTSFLITISPYWLTASPLTVVATVNDIVSGIATVELFYLFSNDNSTWGFWTSYAMDMASPWQWSFDFPDGDGYYEFYSKASDKALNEELATGTETICGYDATLPIADAGLDIDVDEDEQFGLDGSGSTDNLGIADWSWDLGDGNIDLGEIIVHSYPNSGFYIVTLTVKDMAGNTASDTMTVYVNNLAPVADAGADQIVDEGEIVYFDGSGSTDTSSDMGTLMYTWHFGDGAVQSGKTVNHIFKDDGDYIVRLVVKDDDGSTDSDTLNVSANNVAPIANIGGPYSGMEGTEVEFTGSASDQGDDILTYYWDFNNDGQYDDATGQNPTWMWDDVGIYTIGLKVMDDEGAFSTDSEIVNINNVAPIAVANGPYYGFEGNTINFYGDYTDSNPADQVTYLWNFGDGETSTKQNPTHVYADDDVYSVTLTVTDDDSVADEDTTTAVVYNVPPEIESITEPATGTEGELFSLKINATDAGNDEITFSDNTEMFEIDPVTGIIEFVPTYGDVGVTEVIITATDDDGDAATTVLTIEISAAPNSVILVSLVLILLVVLIISIFLILVHFYKRKKSPE